MPNTLKAILAAAGWYNLAFGLFAVLAPALPFRLAGIDPPNYPELWQCVGMIVGVYGIGYLIASRDPARHWPIVLVGLLGKIFGPIGFLWSLASGSFPPSFGWMIVLNDLIWWIPFGMILWYAFKQWAAGSEPGELLDEDGRLPSASLRGDSGETLEELSADRPAMVVFLRHAGCTFHREALSDLVVARPDIQAAGLELAIVHMGEQLPLTDARMRCSLTDVVRFSDPDRRLYRQFGLGRGSLWQLLGPKVWTRGFSACVLKQHGVGKLDGDGLQMPGVFVVYRGRTLVGYRHKTAADRPDYAAIARQAESALPSLLVEDGHFATA